MKKAFFSLLLAALLLGAAACQPSSDVVNEQTPSANPTATATPVATPEPTPTPTRVASPFIPKPPDSQGDDVEPMPDEPDLSFDDLDGLEFWFSSGAGGWYTMVTMLTDGSFVGYYKDSDMGDVGEDYPEGTMYESIFSGKFTSLAKTGDYEYSMRLESLNVEGTLGEEKIVDGIRVITTEPSGFYNADKFMLYLPGKSVDELPQEFLDWVGLTNGLDFEEIDVIDFYGLYNVNGQEGFSA